MYFINVVQIYMKKRLKQKKSLFIAQPEDNLFGKINVK